MYLENDLVQRFQSFKIVMDFNTQKVFIYKQALI